MAASETLKARLRSAVKDDKAVAELITLLDAAAFADVSA